MTLPYINKMDARNKAEIDAAAIFSTKSDDKIPGDYLNLLKSINIKYKNSLTFNETLIFKFRAPVSKFNYENKYSLQVYRIDTLTNLNLDKTISEAYINANLMPNIHYAVDQEGLINFNYNSSQQLPKPSKIYFTLLGLQTHPIIKNDSVAYYYSKMKNLSVQYGINGPLDMLASSYNDNVPTEILFLKKHNALYLLIMTIEDSNIYLNPYMLYNLINN